MNVLIVCTANKIRSPMAMEIANSIAKKRIAKYSFDSAGIALIGTERDANVVQVLEEIGVYTDYVPRAIDTVNIDDYDQIHVMTQRQKITLCSYLRGSDIAEKIVVLGIENPFYEGIEAYRVCRDKLIGFYEAFIK